jgi:hypothetical protein
VQKRESGLREEETHQRRLSLDRTAELETKLISLREGKVSRPLIFALVVNGTERIFEMALQKNR